MATSERTISSISNTSSYEEMGEFWDTHSSADYWEQGRDVEMEIRIPRRHDIAIADEVYKKLTAVSRQQGVQPETLVNLWLSERLRTAPPDAIEAATEGSGEAEAEGAEEKVKG